MKKKFSLKTLIAFVLVAAGVFVYTNLHSKSNAALPVTAFGCKYTGNSSDACYYTYGGRNYKIINCVSGATSCAFTPVVGPVGAE
ncbi:MAG: hypothetical protein JNM88_09905 [Chitinophagaceae bacterium]|nr:hypothetical protein [Chitinophagaceae bacterium]